MMEKSVLSASPPSHFVMRLRAAEVVYDPYPHLRARFGEEAPWPMISVESHLVRHRTGYFLGPHFDWRAKIVVLLIYPAPDEGALHLGTSLYWPKDRGFSCPDSKLYPFDDFVKVKTAPYKPNSLLAFLRSEISFHGVDPLSERDGAACGRGLIQCVIHDKKAREEELRDIQKENQ